LDNAETDGLQPVIGQDFPLERAADTHAAIEARAAIGKTLLLSRTDSQLTRPVPRVETDGGKRG
jgi:hypothetical protein